MPAGAILAIIIVCLLIAVAAAMAAVLEIRLMMTRRQFGPEYDRLADEKGHRGARAELLARRRRVARLGIHPLGESRRAQLRTSWTATQEQFVDAPADAVAAASELVLSVATELGYPSGDREQLMADLSVGHARRLDSFRRAEETAGRVATASTEDLRQALLWYRALFRDLAESGHDGHGPDSPAGRGRLAGARARAASALGVFSAAAALGRARRRMPRPRVRMPSIPRPSHPSRPSRPSERPRVRLPRLPRLRRRLPGPSQSQRQGANPA